MRRDLLDDLLERRAEGTALVVSTDLETGEQRLLEPLNGLPADLPAELATAVVDAVHADRSHVIEVGGARHFLHVYNPPVRVIVVGAVHIAQPLTRMASDAGFEAIVVDPREAFATEDRFPGVRRLLRWPDAALEELAPDHRTAVITVTHDPKLDDPALISALDSPAFYVGALGSRRTHAKRVQRLEEAGVPAESIDRIHAPVGLDVGARTPGEIAASVLAQLIQVLRSGDR